MKTWVRKSLKVGVLSAGIILVAGGAAQADWNTSENDGVLTGNQVLADIDVPINVCGNAVGVLGDAGAACATDGAGSGDTESLGAWETGGNDGVGTGNQVAVPVEVPINICGNAVGVLADATAACQIGGDGEGTGGYGSGAQTESWTTGDNGGALTGNQVLADIDVPINVCGNAISVAGDSAAACAISTNGGGDAESGAWDTSGNDGVLTGNQLAAIIDVPINVCGNAVAVLGDATAACSIGGELPEQPDGEEPDGEEPTEPTDPGDGGNQGGYGDQARGGQAEALPIFGSVAGLHKLTQAVPAFETVSARDGGSGWTTSDNDGVLTGNQVLLDVDVPVNVAGNAVGVLGDAVAVGHIM